MRSLSDANKAARHRKCVRSFLRRNGMDRVEIILPAQLDMAALPDLKEALEAAAMSLNALRVDGSGVERVGTPAIQLLLAAVNAFSDGGRSFTLEALSQELSAALDDLGLGLQTCQWSVG